MRCLAILGSLLALAFPIVGQDLIINGNVMSYDLAVGPNGGSHLVVLDGFTKKLYYLRWAGGSWGTPQLICNTNLPGWGRVSLAVDGGGHCHAVFDSYDMGTENLTYAHNTNGFWVAQLVDTSCEMPSVQVDSWGIVHLAYRKQGLGLRYAVYVLGFWTYYDLDLTGGPIEPIGRYPDLALDSLDRVHISYYDQWTRTVRYAYDGGVSWMIGVLVAVGDISGGRAALAMDGNDDPHFVYVRSGALTHRYKTASTWTQETVGNAHHPYAASLDMEFDAGGNPMILYSGHESTAQGLWLAYRPGGGGWQQREIATFETLEAVLAPYQEVVHLAFDDSLSGDLYHDRLFGRAVVTNRNAGTNPQSYSHTSLPVLGSTFGAVVDLAGTTGHGMAWLAGYFAPATWTLGTGQTLLVDVRDPRGELLGQNWQLVPSATFSVAIPNSLYLWGFDVSTQALHYGGGQPFALSNALDLQLGRY